MPRKCFFSTQAEQPSCGKNRSEKCVSDQVIRKNEWHSKSMVTSESPSHNKTELSLKSPSSFFISQSGLLMPNSALRKTGGAKI